MTDTLPLLLSLLAGVGLGLFYFGGLWLTTQRLHTARHPALLALGSFWARTGITLAALYLVMDGRWERLALSMAGFVVARLVLVERWKPQQPPTPSGD